MGYFFGTFTLSTASLRRILVLPNCIIVGFFIYLLCMLGNESICFFVLVDSCLSDPLELFLLAVVVSWTRGIDRTIYKLRDIIEF